MIQLHIYTLRLLYFSDYYIFSYYFHYRLLQDIKHCSLSYTVSFFENTLLKHLKVYYQNCVTITTI